MGSQTCLLTALEGIPNFGVGVGVFSVSLVDFQFQLPLREKSSPLGHPLGCAPHGTFFSKESVYPSGLLM